MRQQQIAAATTALSPWQPFVSAGRIKPDNGAKNIVIDLACSLNVYQSNLSFVEKKLYVNS